MTKATKLKGIPLKVFENLTIGQIRKLDKHFREKTNIKLVKNYGKESKL